MQTNSEKPKQPPLLISINEISEEALVGIIENFILREGTDYGIQEVGYEKKSEQIRQQIEKKDVLIVFEPESESVTLLTEKQYKSLKNHFVQNEPGESREL